jgi:hypothetical protein
MAALGNGNTPATDLAFDRLIELVQLDEIDVPNGSTLVPADLPEFQKVMDRRLAEDKPIVIVYPDGSEQLVEPAEVRAAPGSAAQPR